MKCPDCGSVASEVIEWFVMATKNDVRQNRVWECSNDKCNLKTFHTEHTKSKERVVG